MNMGIIEGKTDRREFLKGAAACGAIAAAGACAANAQAAEEPQWDEEFDAVVIGSGTALMAALTAAGQGAKVLVVEKGSIIGGTTLFGGSFWLPNNPLMAEGGIEDSREEGLSYIKACAEAWGGQYDEEVIEAYLDGGIEMVNMLREQYGYEMTMSSFGKGDYFGLPGAQMTGRTVGIVQDGAAVELSSVWPLLIQNCKDNGVEIRTETEALHLVADEGGTVTGVVVQDENGISRIRTNKGVVIGTGSFDHNDEMVRTYLREPMYTTLAMVTATGDGHRMAMEVGAAMTNMQSTWGAPFLHVDPEEDRYAIDFSSVRNKPGSIIVNRHGERFADEASAYPVFHRTFNTYDISRSEWRNIPAYLIFDEHFAENYPTAGFKSKAGEIPVGAVRADSLEELAGILDIDAAGLASTVEGFNAAAEEGVDNDWLRGTSSPFSLSGGDHERDDIANPSMGAIAEGPFYGIAVYPGSIGTCGGVKINANAQAIGLDGEVIPGLYAVGNASGSIFGGAYPGPGATIGSGLVMAYLAGNHIASK